MAVSKEVNGQAPLSILLVEDDPGHAELIKRSFAEHHIPNEIIHLTEGEQALAYLFRRHVYADEEASPRPHVVLLDLRLPRVDGLEVLKQLRRAVDEELRRLPVVILTASEDEHDVRAAYAHHVNSYLVKPLEYEGFSALMDNLGRYWLGWNHFPWFEEEAKRGGV